MDSAKYNSNMICVMEASLAEQPSPAIAADLMLSLDGEDINLHLEGAILHELASEGMGKAHQILCNANQIFFWDIKNSL